MFLASGLALLAVWGAARFQSAISSQAIARFESAAEASPWEDAASAKDPVLSSPVDFGLWSPKRIAAYEESLARKTDTPLAILRIPKVHLEVPVFNDIDDLTLNRGAGRILGTVRVGESGNLGIAGHRDGFSGGLHSISPGDVMELARHGHSDQYVVSEICIVSADDVSLLRPTARPTLTLVTCFPFYFVGHAPKRYIVKARLVNDSDLGAGTAPSSRTRTPQTRRPTLATRAGECKGHLHPDRLVTTSLNIKLEGSQSRMFSDLACELPQRVDPRGRKNGLSVVSSVGLAVRLADLATQTAIESLACVFLGIVNTPSRPSPVTFDRCGMFSGN